MGWGTAVKKIRVGVFADDIKKPKVDADTAKVKVKFKIDRGVNIVDAVNELTVGCSLFYPKLGKKSNVWSLFDGDTLVDVNVSGKGEKTLVTKTYKIPVSDEISKAMFWIEFRKLEYPGKTLMAETVQLLPW